MLPEIDDEFAKAFGVSEGGVESLHQEIRGALEGTRADEQLVEHHAQAVDIRAAIELERLRLLGRQILGRAVDDARLRELCLV